MLSFPPWLGRVALVSFAASVCLLAALPAQAQYTYGLYGYPGAGYYSFGTGEYLTADGLDGYFYDDSYYDDDWYYDYYDFGLEYPFPAAAEYGGYGPVGYEYYSYYPDLDDPEPELRNGAYFAGDYFEPPYESPYFDEPYAADAIDDGYEDFDLNEYGDFGDVPNERFAPGYY